jgi:hypothetical protein
MGMFCLVLFPLTVLPTVLAVPDKRSIRTETLGLKDALELPKFYEDNFRRVFNV